MSSVGRILLRRHAQPFVLYAHTTDPNPKTKEDTPNLGTYTIKGTLSKRKFDNAPGLVKDSEDDDFSWLDTFADAGAPAPEA